MLFFELILPFYGMLYQRKRFFMLKKETKLPFVPIKKVILIKNIITGLLLLLEHHCKNIAASI